MTVTAAVLTHYIAARKDKQRQKTEAEIAGIEKDIAFALERYNLSRTISDFGTVLNFLSQLFHLMTQVPDEVSMAFANSIVGRIVASISDLHSAATGNVSTQQQVDGWTSIARKATAGDKSANQRLTEIHEELELEMVRRNHSLVDERERLRIVKLGLDLGAERARYIGLGFQILGLVIVLFKGVHF